MARSEEPGGVDDEMREKGAREVSRGDEHDGEKSAEDSRAAARAWGVLRGEGRWIVAALLPLGD